MKYIILALLLTTPAIAQQHFLDSDEIAEAKGVVYACGCSTSSPQVPVFNIPQDQLLGYRAVEKRCEALQDKFTSVSEGIYAQMLKCGPLTVRKDRMQFIADTVQPVNFNTLINMVETLTVKVDELDTALKESKEKVKELNYRVETKPSGPSHHDIQQEIKEAIQRAQPWRPKPHDPNRDVGR